ncbi:hypothetical protein [uncultured Roseobacter sp.]|nr:hypothetical protein [uncultured Roseobacter sp.]
MILVWERHARSDAHGLKRRSIQIADRSNAVALDFLKRHEYPHKNRKA